MQWTRWLTLAGTFLFGGAWIELSMLIVAEEEAGAGSVMIYPVLIAEQAPPDVDTFSRLEQYTTWQQAAGWITMEMAAIHCIVLNLALQQLQRERIPPADS